MTLAPREKQVAQLAANGMTNRQIATELHLTVGSVKVYLTKVFRKLGVRGRIELMAQRENLGSDVDHLPSE